VEAEARGHRQWRYTRMHASSLDDLTKKHRIRSLEPTCIYKFLLKGQHI
jgi:hypothetical protein